MFEWFGELTADNLWLKEWLALVSAVVPVYAVIAVGAGARRVNWLTHEADESMLKLVLRVLLPCFILDVLIGNQRVLVLGDMWLPPLVGLGTLALGYMLCIVLVRLLHRHMGLMDVIQQRTFSFATGTYNWGYIPIPLVMMKYDNDTLGVLIVHNLGVEIGLWSLGLIVLSGGMKAGWWKHIINPPLISILLALVINMTGAHAYVPTFIRTIFHMLGICSIPMGLILVGAIMADHFDKDSLRQGKSTTAWGCILRLGAIPALFMTLAWFAPLPEDLRIVVVIQAAMPAAAFPIVMSKHYNGDPPTALRVVLGTSLLSLLTIPLALSLATHLELL